MDLGSYRVIDLIEMYSEIVAEFRKRGVLRTNNVVGELGEYIVIENYLKNPELPNLSSLPVGTQNVNAMSQTGQRYSIKSISSTTTSVIYGLEPPESKKKNPQLFEYLVICKFGKDFSVEGIYELNWDMFLEHKKWNSRMQAWNIQLTNAVKKDSRTIFSNEESVHEENKSIEKKGKSAKNIATKNTTNVVWNMSKGLDHKSIRKSAAEIVARKIGTRFNEDSTARYIDNQREIALFIASASYSAKNKEFWYSINDEIIPWLETFPKAYVAFAMGGDKNIMLFELEVFKELLPGCLRTEEDSDKRKVAHYHISFDVETSNVVYFKKKKPERDFVEVSRYLIKG